MSAHHAVTRAQEAAHESLFWRADACRHMRECMIGQGWRECSCLRAAVVAAMRETQAAPADD